MRHRMIVLNREGDFSVDWDPKVQAEIERATAEFETLRQRGYVAFPFKGGSRLDFFDFDAPPAHHAICPDGVECAVLERSATATGPDIFDEPSALPRRQKSAHDGAQRDRAGAQVAEDLSDIFVLDRRTGEPLLSDFGLSLDLEEAERLGPVLERHPDFPDRTNVEFVAREGGGLRVVVWERGCGLTQACGTGACAAVAAFVKRGVLGTGGLMLGRGLLLTALAFAAYAGVAAPLSTTRTRRAEGPSWTVARTDLLDSARRALVASAALTPHAAGSAGAIEMTWRFVTPAGARRGLPGSFTEAIDTNVHGSCGNSPRATAAYGASTSSLGAIQ